MTYLEGVLIALDQFINAILGGWPDETLSSRCWRWSLAPAYRGRAAFLESWALPARIRWRAEKAAMPAGVAEGIAASTGRKRRERAEVVSALLRFRGYPFRSWRICRFVPSARSPLFSPETP